MGGLRPPFDNKESTMLQLVVPRFFKNIPSRMCHRFKEVRAATHEIVTYTYGRGVPPCKRSVYDRINEDRIVPTNTDGSSTLQKLAIIVEKGELAVHAQCGHIMNHIFYREIEESEVGKKCRKCWRYS